MSETNDERDMAAEQPLEGMDENGDALEGAVGESKPGIGRGSLLIFCLVVAGALGIYAMRWRSGPAAAQANPESEAAKASITQFLSSGNQNLQAMQDLLKNTERVVEQFSAFPSTTQVPLAELRTNPFKLLVSSGPAPDVSEAAARRQRELERAAVLKAVQTLQLQSIAFSDSKRACLINGALYTEGQQIDSFIVERISVNSVVVKNGMYRFELRMQR